MSPLRVLIVEDNVLISVLLVALLAELGHETCGTAATEEEGVSAAIRHRPDLMIVDAGLAQGSGVSAIETVLRSGPMAHFFISGDVQRVLSRRPGAIVLRKPFRKAELARAIDMALAAPPLEAL